MLLGVTLLNLILFLSRVHSSLASDQNKNQGQQKQQIFVNMPEIRPERADQYLCVAQRVPASQNGHYIVGFNPKSDPHKAHHMLLYGCQEPGVYERDSPRLTWDCGHMLDKSADSPTNEIDSFTKAPICKGYQQILYGWAMGAPGFELQEGVGFKIGQPETKINFLVLQVHYGHTHVFHDLPYLTDNSGLMLDLIPNKPESGITKQAGVLILISLGFVEQGKSRHEIWCDIDEDVEIHPFRYRVHTHKLGTRVLGAKLDTSTTGDKIYRAENDVIIGVGNPQEPQTFFPVKETNMTITKGDTVYAYCEFNNNGSSIVSIGSTGNDEMCNFYLMYWTESPNLLMKSNCYGRNPKRILDLRWG